MNLAKEFSIRNVIARVFQLLYFYAFRVSFGYAQDRFRGLSFLAIQSWIADEKFA